MTADADANKNKVLPSEAVPATGDFLDTVIKPAFTRFLDIELDRLNPTPKNQPQSTAAAPNGNIQPVQANNFPPKNYSATPYERPGTSKMGDFTTYILYTLLFLMGGFLIVRLVAK